MARTARQTTSSSTVGRKPEDLSRLKEPLLDGAPHHAHACPPPPAPLPPHIGLAALDAKLSASLHGICADSELLRSLCLVFEHSGNGLLSIPLVFLLWLLLPSSSPPTDTVEQVRTFFLGTFLALLIDLAVVGLIKALFRRPRPAYNRPDMALVVAVDRFSFPSGHASRALLLASLFLLQQAIFPPTVSLRIPFPRPLTHWLRLILPMSSAQASLLPPALSAWLANPFALLHLRTSLVPRLVCTWAALTASSRVLLGRHYAGDVLVGCLLGCLEAQFALAFVWPSLLGPSLSWHRALWRFLNGGR